MAYPYNNPYNQQMMQQGYQGMQQSQLQGQQMQIQNGGFISVPSEDVARSYPVAPGTSITFKNENAPYIYTKTMGFSPFESPRFEKYRLEKEEEPAPASVSSEDPYKKIREDMDLMRAEIERLKEMIKKGEALNESVSNASAVEE